MDREASGRVVADAGVGGGSPAGDVIQDVGRVDVLGVGVSAIDLPMALDLLSSWAGRREHRYVCVTGVHGVMESVRDADLRQVHNESGLTTPDGMPMVWAGRWAGARHMGRVYGPDLLLAVCERGVELGWRHYFYGGKEGVADLLSTRLRERFPALQVVGTYSPPFRALAAEEADAIVESINAARPHFVWVGLSTPKQERWMAAQTQNIPAILIGVGAAFDIHAGLLPQAPRWMRGTGLEWAYRLVREPRRLWRRYLRNNPAFVLALLRRRPVLRPLLTSRDTAPPLGGDVGP